jgi:hypothetical protein
MISQSVLVSSPIWGSQLDFNYCLTAIVDLTMGAALSDEGGGSVICHSHSQQYVMSIIF